MEIIFNRSGNEKKETETLVKMQKMIQELIQEIDKQKNDAILNDKDYDLPKIEKIAFEFYKKYPRR